MVPYVYKAVCTNVVDGDTIDCVIDVGFHLTTTQRLRLIGIDTPEHDEPGYREATEFTASCILGREIYIETYKTDAFGRYLADVYFYDEKGNERHLNQLLLEKGLAKVFTKRD